MQETAKREQFIFNYIFVVRFNLENG